MSTPVTTPAEAIALCETTAQDLEDLAVSGIARSDTAVAINALRRLAAIIGERKTHV